MNTSLIAIMNFFNKKQKTKKPKMRLTFGMILRRGHYLYFLYYWLYEKITDHRLFGKTLNKTVYNLSANNYPAQSISYPYLREFIKRTKYQENEVFVDVGCAWGRLIAYLNIHTNLNKFIGVEINPQVAQYAEQSFKNNPEVQIIQGDVVDKLPKNGTTFFLFNPFDTMVMERFLDSIEQNIDHPIRLLYLHPTCRTAIEKRSSHWHLVSKVELKPKHLGALILCEYRYVPAPSCTLCDIFESTL